MLGHMTFWKGYVFQEDPPNGPTRTARRLADGHDGDDTWPKQPRPTWAQRHLLPHLHHHAHHGA